MMARIIYFCKKFLIKQEFYHFIWNYIYKLDYDTILAKFF
jgi:hypothetical protein